MAAKQEITDLTICRAAFAAWVFVYHADLYLNFSAWLGPFRGLIRHGYLGVDGFFILSGLILARVHPELGRTRSGRFLFWGKRLARIYPLQLATLLLFSAVLLGGHAAGLAPRNPAHFATGAFVQNLLLVQGWGFSGQGAWNYPSWTLSTEWAGYLLFPFLWFAACYYATLVAIQFAVVCGVVMAFTAYLSPHGLNLAYTWGLVRFFPEFLLGICTARFVPAYADYAPLGGIAGVGLAAALLGAMTGVDPLAVIGLWAILFAFMMQRDAERPAMLGNHPVLNFLGRLSYAFYMSFALAELLTVQFFRRQSWPPAAHALIFAGCMTGITFVLAVILHFAIELPCRRGLDRWLERRSPSSAIGSNNPPVHAEGH